MKQNLEGRPCVEACHTHADLLEVPEPDVEEVQTGVEQVLELVYGEDALLVVVVPLQLGLLLVVQLIQQLDCLQVLVLPEDSDVVPVQGQTLRQESRTMMSLGTSLALEYTSQ